MSAVNAKAASLADRLTGSLAIATRSLRVRFGGHHLDQLNIGSQ
jgi:hypothetical protein